MTDQKPDMTQELRVAQEALPTGRWATCCGAGGSRERRCGMTPAADSDSWPGGDDDTSITRSRALVALLTLADGTI